MSRRSCRGARYTGGGNEIANQGGRSNGKPSPKGGGATGGAEDSVVEATTKHPATSRPEASEKRRVGSDCHAERTGLPLAIERCRRSPPGVVVLCPFALGLTNCHTLLLRENWVEMSDDKGEKPKPGQPMPPVLKDLGAKAIKRHERRQATPEIEVTSLEGSWSFGSPYREEDEDEWVALLFDAFATRSNAAFHVFTTQLAELCSTNWQGEGQGWVPDHWELRAAIQIVRSTKPRNEAEACLAAQMVAVHLMQMKLSKQALNGGYSEPRSCAIAGKLARTYALQLETMAKLKGRGSRQRITVRKYSQHEHKHIHLHQGGSENGNQPHGPRGTRATEISAASELEKRTSLSGQDASRDIMPVPDCEGAEEMPATRRRDRLRGSQRLSKRSV